MPVRPLVFARLGQLQACLSYTLYDLGLLHMSPVDQNGIILPSI